MQPGDTCVVRGGVYRETVRPTRSGTEGKPIRFVAAEGERVVLDGTEPVEGAWRLWKGSIYQIEVAEPVEQLFVDGKMQIEARWPNMRFEEVWDRSKWARSDHGSRKDLMICADVADTGIDWTGALATLNVAHQYKTWTRTVTAHSVGSAELTYELNERLGDGADSGPSWADDYFYLSGKFEALDAPTEWSHDAANGVLYLWCEDGQSPAGRRVTAKRRAYALDALKRDHVEIIGFHLFATTLRLNRCSHCVVGNCRLLFPVYARRFEERTPEGKRKPEIVTLVVGDHNVIRNTSIAFSNLGGLLVRGKHNRTENCIVHDVNWGGNIAHAGICMAGSAKEDNHNVMTHCTVYGVGNIGILYSGRANVIEYNHVYGTGRACRDIAAVHTGGVRAMGSVAHHNWVHDSTNLGMRGDDQTRGLTFHHNVVWNCRRGLIMKGNHNRVYNNTVLVDPKAKYATASIIIPKCAEPKKWWTRNPTLAVQNEDTLVCNNASFLIGDRGNTPIPASERVSHNVTRPRGLAGVFVNASAEALRDGTFDFRPAPGSPLIDAGRVIPGFTGRHRGKAPDAGAYESGEKRWIAGADWQDEPLGVELVVRLEAPRTHHSVPLPKPLYASGIGAKGLRKLQALYDELWAEGDRASVRRKAIALRERHSKGSAQWKQHHAVVAKLHREVWLLLRERGGGVVSQKDQEAFDRVMGRK